MRDLSPESADFAQQNECLSRDVSVEAAILLNQKESRSISEVSFWPFLGRQGRAEIPVPLADNRQALLAATPPACAGCRGGPRRFEI
jgi:hypothetical protein